MEHSRLAHNIGGMHRPLNNERIKETAIRQSLQVSYRSPIKPADGRGNTERSHRQA